MATTYQDRIKLKELESENEFRRNAPEILDKESAARFLGVSVRSLVEALDDQKIPRRQIGKTLIFSRDALVDWVKSKKTT